jgi:hypothetical protein
MLQVMYMYSRETCDIMVCSTAHRSTSKVAEGIDLLHGSVGAENPCEDNRSPRHTWLQSEFYSRHGERQSDSWFL